MKLSPYIHIIRPLNLVIVFFTQSLLYHLVVFQNIRFPTLNFNLALLLSGCTSIIAACGYIINDFFDKEIDFINKPSTTWIGSFISNKSAMVYYWGLFSIGLMLSYYIAYRTENLPLMPIYPLAQFLLYFYAKKWKLAGFIGNNVVALMASFVSIVIIVAERKSLMLPENKYSLILIAAFGAFAYFVNLIREMVKDMEDMEGDKLRQSKSLPIQYGIERTKVLIYFNGAIMLVFISFFLLFFPQKVISMYYAITFVCLPVCYLMVRLSKAAVKADFTLISKFVKMIMLSGLIYLILLSQN